MTSTSMCLSECICSRGLGPFDLGGNSWDLRGISLWQPGATVARDPRDDTGLFLQVLNMQTVLYPRNAAWYRRGVVHQRDIELHKSHTGSLIRTTVRTQRDKQDPSHPNIWMEQTPQKTTLPLPNRHRAQNSLGRKKERFELATVARGDFQPGFPPNHGAPAASGGPAGSVGAW